MTRTVNKRHMSERKNTTLFDIKHDTLGTDEPSFLQSHLTSLKLPLVPGISEGNSSGVLLPHDL